MGGVILGCKITFPMYVDVIDIITATPGYPRGQQLGGAWMRRNGRGDINDKEGIFILVALKETREIEVVISQGWVFCAHLLIFIKSI